MIQFGALLFILVCVGVANAFTTTSSLAQIRTFNPQHEPINFAETSTRPLPTPCFRTRPLSAGLEVIEPSYNLAIGSLALGAAFGVPGSPLKSKLSAFLGAIPLTLFGLFLAYQTTTLRFTFDDENFSLVKSNLDSTGENVVVGGENVWAHNKVVNYDLL